MLKRNNGRNTDKKKKGQSTIEYIILVAGVLAVLLIFLGPSGVFQRAYDAMLNRGTDGMINMANKLALSHGAL